MPLYPFEMSHYQQAAEKILARTRHRPTIGVVLGSGLGSFAQAVQDADTIPYEEIPNWPHSQVVGHSNRLVIGTLEGKSVLVQQGRAHFYEGWSMAQVGFPVRVMSLLGVNTLIVTNAAGGLNPAFDAGDLMLITDHINLLGLVGNNPLLGPNEDQFGSRFPAMTIAYDKALRQTARQVATAENLSLREGVYIGLSGPMFETPAEIRMMRTMGADAVGMSTVGEVTVARHIGMRVLGFSGITNKCIDSQESDLVANHEEVLEVGKLIVPNLIRLLRGVIAAL